MRLLETYLNTMQLGIRTPVNSDMSGFLSNYKTFKVFNTPTLRESGLLKEEVNYEAAYLFEFEQQEILEFHTFGMEHPIDIHYFDDKGMRTKTDYSCQKDKNYNSDKPSKYVVEVFTKCKK